MCNFPARPRTCSHRPRSRRAFTLTELLVSATLLVCAISVVGPLTVATGRLQRDARQVRLAVDEVANQLEVLTTLPADQLDAALEEITPSAVTRGALPNATLSVERDSDSESPRLTVSIAWDRPGGSPPVSLVAWLEPPKDEEETEP